MVRTKQSATWPFFFAAVMLLLSSGTASAGTLSRPLHLTDEGVFYVNGERAASAMPRLSLPGGVSGLPQTNYESPDHIIVKQMYVHFRVPEQTNGLSIVMIGGSGDTGASYETTPDGREGWATYFTRKGFTTYVVDGPGRGRAYFDPTVINMVKAGLLPPDALPEITIPTIESSFVGLRIGPRPGEAWPGSQFPIEALDAYAATGAPSAESTLGNGRAITVAALEALGEKIGPAIYFVHSQSGLYGLTLMAKRPDLVKGVVATEGSCIAVTDAEKKSYPQDKAEEALMQAPFLSIFGDYAEHYLDSWNGIKRRESCREMIARIAADGAPATFLHLPAHGVHGNSHAMVLEKNNLRIADLVIDWIEKTVDKD